MMTAAGEAPHALEVIYWILGGAGLFALGVATLVVAAGVRGVPMLRSNTLHRHTVAAKEPCDAVIEQPTPGITWSVWAEVANVGRGFLIVDGGGLLNREDGVITVGMPSWTVNGAIRTEPFSLAPGEIARTDLELPPDRAPWTGKVRVFITVRRMIGFKMRRAQMTIAPGPGSTEAFEFIKTPTSVTSHV